MLDSVYRDISVETGKRQIRVAHLLPGCWDDDISCELHKVSLEENPAYEALSYVWGDPKATLPITLNGSLFHVTTNLGSALRRLRKTTKKRVIWIDALCINQQDMQERNEQVKIMGAIYASSQELLLWLGEHRDLQAPVKIKQATSGTNERPIPWLLGATNGYQSDVLDDPRLEQDPIFAGFTIVHMIAENKHLNELPCFMLTHDSKLRVNAQLPGGLKGLELLMQVKWWSRIRTVQETILPRKATVIYGSFEAPWRMFADAASALLHHCNSCCLPLIHTLEAEDDRMLDLLYRKVTEVEAIRDDLTRQDTTNLYNLLQMFSTRQASDARDKVYALLGLINTRSHGGSIAPDYSLTKQQVYESVTLEILRSGKSLKPFEGGFINHAGLPSRVLDWENAPSPFLKHIEIQRNYMNRCYGLLKHHELHLRLLPDSLLEMKGMRVATVSGVSAAKDPHDWNASLATCEDLLGLAGVSSPDQVYVGGSTWKDAYWRTLVGDLITVPKAGGREYRRTQPEDQASYRNWRSVFYGNKTPETDALRKTKGFRDFNASASSMTAGRRLFVSAKGYMGVGPPEMRPGDAVYALCGGRVPFILR